MNTKQEMKVKLSDQEFKALLAEYDALRSEITNTQNQRMQIISLTIGAFGAILSISGGIVLGSGTLDPPRRLLVAVGGAVVTYAIVIPSLIMMISAQQSIHRLGGYIREFIEPRVPGLSWQHHWNNFKTQHKFRGGFRSMGGIYYYLSILPVLLPLYALSQFPWGWAAILVLVPFFVWSIYLSHNLQTSGRGWERARWEDYIGTVECDMLKVVGIPSMAKQRAAAQQAHLRSVHSKTPMTKR